MLQLVVQHARYGIKDIASWLQINHACRNALQQAVGQLEVYDCHFQYSTERLAAFAAWLPRHAGLVARLLLTSWAHEGDSSDDQAPAAEQLITFALQLTCAPALAAAPSAALQLQSFSTLYVFSPAALNSLAVCSGLTNLELSMMSKQRVTVAFCESIGRLCSLKKLHCSLYADEPEADVFPHRFAEALAHLCKLESLQAHSKLPLSGLTHLPSSLRQMYVELDHAHGPPADVDLSHLVNLQELECSIPGGMGSSSIMPAGLSGLTVIGPVEASKGLQQVQELLLCDADGSLPLLQQLPAMTALQYLRLGLGGCNHQQLQDVAAAVSAGTQLTGLDLFNTQSDQWHDDDTTLDLGTTQLHSSLALLPRLKALHISGLSINDEDAMHFTALSSLTELELAHLPNIGDLAIAAMMNRLTGLRLLCLHALEISSPLLWPAVACLTNLQRLSCDCCGPTAQTLHLLAPLTNLTSLELEEETDDDGSRLMTVEAERSFLQKIPHLFGIAWL